METERSSARAKCVQIKAGKCIKKVFHNTKCKVTIIFFQLGGRADSPGKPEDKENFAQLLRELRPAFDKHGLLLTAAVSAGKNTIDKAYEVTTMSETLDFINVMTYDFHGWSVKSLLFFQLHI